MTMLNLILVTFYSISFITVCKLFVKNRAKQYPNLNWDFNDTFTCLGVAFTCPISIFIFGIPYLYNLFEKKNISLLPFKRWFDKEVNKNKVN